MGRKWGANLTKNGVLNLTKSRLFGVLPALLGNVLQSVPSPLEWPGPQFSHLYNGRNDRTFFIVLLSGISEVILVKILEHSWHVINLHMSLIN